MAGERRWQAARHAGLPTITCMVFDRDLENLLRENLTKTEQAKAFQTFTPGNGDGIVVLRMRPSVGPTDLGSGT